MSLNSSLRARFTDEALNTASGPRVVIMAYDRLDRDLAGAIGAIERHDPQHAHVLLCHAQDLVHELLCMLDLDVWEHAASLAAIYRYVTDLLTIANVNKRAREAAEARTLLAELGEAFRTASTSALAAPIDIARPDQPAGASFGALKAGSDGPRREFSVRA